MTTDLHGQKNALRKQIRFVLQNMPTAAQMVASGQIRARLQEHAIWRNAKSVLFFAPLPDEVDVWPLLEEALVAGRTAALPRFDAEHQNYVACQVRNLPGEIATGQFGVREPSGGCPEISPGNLDLILGPGVAFDLKGHRLGRGQGFYDRLLAKVRGVKCGVAFEEQIVKVVGVRTHDIPMDFIVTPRRCVKT
jgi:5-formyltetrahydrofolate cyclo-ligase